MTLSFSCASFAVRCSCSIFSIHSKIFSSIVPFLLVGNLDLEQMSLVFLIGFQLGQPRLHFLSVRFMRFKILFVRPPLLDESLHGGTGLLMELLGFSKRGFNRLESLWDFSALVLDLRDAEIQLLQLDKGGKILVQRTPIAVVPNNDLNR